MDTNQPFVGNHTPLVKLAGAESRGIRQTGPSFVQGQTYEGRVQQAGGPSGPDWPPDNGPGAAAGSWRSWPSPHRAPPRWHPASDKRRGTRAVAGRTPRPAARRAAVDLGTAMSGAPARDNLARKPRTTEVRRFAPVANATGCPVVVKPADAEQSHRQHTQSARSPLARVESVDAEMPGEGEQNPHAGAVHRTTTNSPQNCHASPTWLPDASWIRGRVPSRTHIARVGCPEFDRE